VGVDEWTKISRFEDVHTQTHKHTGMPVPAPTKPNAPGSGSAAARTKSAPNVARILEGKAFINGFVVFCSYDGSDILNGW